MSKKWKSWLKVAMIRAVRTIAQTAAASLGTGAVMADINWLYIVSTAALSGVLSILMSISELPKIKEETE